MVKSITTRLGQTRWSSGTDNVRRTDFDTDASKLEDLVVIFGQGLLSARPAAGVRGRFYVVSGETDTKLNGRVYYDNGSVWTTNKYLTDAVLESSTANNSALTVKGATTQAADIFSVVASDASQLLRVTGTGVTSNQTSPGVSGGVSLGRVATHDAAIAAVSVAANKPVLSLRGATGQTSSLVDVKNSLSVSMFSVSPTGDGYFDNSISAKQISAINSVVSSGISSTSSANLVNLTVTPLNSSTPGAKFMASTSPQANLVEFQTSTGARMARVSSDGTVATNTRVVIGGTNGDLTQTSYPTNTAALWIKNNYPTAPVARLVANDQQQANLLEVVNSAAATVLSVNNSGGITANSTLRVPSIAVGAALTQWQSGYQPLVEITTGTAAGPYDESVVIRHAVTSADASASRSLGLVFKMSNESTALESSKWAGIKAISETPNSTSPSLALFANGIEGARLFANQSFDVTNYLTTPLVKTYNIDLRDNGLAAIGAQGGQAVYFRGSNFYWYNNGVSSNIAGDAGGGTTPMHLINNRLTVTQLSARGGQSFDSIDPSFSIGDIDDFHMQFSTATITAFNANNAQSATLNLQPNGRLNLGTDTSDVRLPSKVIYFGANKVYFGGAVFEPGSPIQNDWWFDNSNESIRVRRGDGTWYKVAGRA